MEYRKHNRLCSSRALLQESLHDRFILRQIIGAGIVRLPAGPMLSNRVLIPALANAASGQACQWYTALAARVFVYHNDNFPHPSMECRATPA